MKRHSRWVETFQIEKSNRDRLMLTDALCPAVMNTLSNPFRFLGAEFADAGSVRYN